MENSYSVVMISLNEKELLNYVLLQDKYVPEAIEAAIEELKNRGKTFTPGEWTEIQEKLRERKKAQEQDGIPLIPETPKSPPPETPLVNELPYFFSEYSLYLFSIISGPFFASILLAMNCWKVGKKSGAVATILFGVLFMIFSTFAIYYWNLNLLISLLFYGLGALILHQVFWVRYLGRNTPYRPRPLWGPLMIAILIYLVFFVLIYFFQPRLMPHG